MAINKVEANGETLIDLTSDTATENDVIEGKTLHLASGAVATGTYRPSDEIETRLRATVGHSSKNLLDLNKYTYSSGISNVIIDAATGSLSYTGTGTHISLGFYAANLGVEMYGKTYTVSCINNLASTVNGRLAIRKAGTNQIVTRVGFDSTGKKSITFTPDVETFPNGWYISVMATGSKSTTGKIDVSNLMLRDGSISDDTFEPYVTPTDERVSSLDIAAANVSQYVPDPDEGIYWITIIDHYSTPNNRFDIYISTPNSNDRSYFFGTLEDHPIPECEVKLPRFHSYKEKAISFGIIADTTDQVMAISSKPGIFSPSHSTSMWDKIFDVDTFLDFCDVKDGSATNYMHIHLCKDGGIRSQAEYEAYIGS